MEGHIRSTSLIQLSLSQIYPMTLYATHTQTHARCWHVWRKVTLHAAQSHTSPASDCLCASSKCLMSSLKAYKLTLLQAILTPLTPGVLLQLSSSHQLLLVKTGREPVPSWTDWYSNDSPVRSGFIVSQPSIIKKKNPISLIICLWSFNLLSSLWCGIDSKWTINLYARGTHPFEWIKYLAIEVSK